MVVSQQRLKIIYICYDIIFTNMYKTVKDEIFTLQKELRPAILRRSQL